MTVTIPQDTARDEAAVSASSSPKRKEKANIRRRGNSWVVRFRRDGRSVWKSFKTKDEAERFLAEARLRRALRQPEPALRRMRFSAFAAEWLREHRAHVGPATYVNYESVLRVHLLPELGDRSLTEITRREIDAIVADWVAAGPRFQERLRLARELEQTRAREEKRKPRPVRLGHNAKTVSNAIVPLREMLGHAVEWGYLSVNPCVGVRRPRAAQRGEEMMRVLEPVQVRRLLQAAENTAERTLLLTAVMTGARRGELLGLHWGDVDRDRARVWVRRSIGLNGAVQHPKSRRSVRAIAMTQTLSSALRDLRVASMHKQPDDYVFVSERGTPLDGRNVSRAFTAALKRAGLPSMRFHDLRHTFASLLVQQGAHPKYISEQLGHASVQITMDRYAHLFDTSYADESAKLEEAVFGMRGDTGRMGAAV